MRRSASVARRRSSRRCVAHRSEILRIRASTTRRSARIASAVSRGERGFEAAPPPSVPRSRRRESRRGLRRLVGRRLLLFFLRLFFLLLFGDVRGGSARYASAATSAAAASGRGPSAAPVGSPSSPPSPPRSPPSSPRARARARPASRPPRPGRGAPRPAGLAEDVRRPPRGGGFFGGAVVRVVALPRVVVFAALLGGGTFLPLLLRERLAPSRGVVVPEHGLRLRELIELELHERDVVALDDGGAVGHPPVARDARALRRSLGELLVAPVPERVPEFVHANQQFALRARVPPVVRSTSLNAL